MNVQLCFFFNGVPIVDSWFCSRLYRGADEHDRGEGGGGGGEGEGGGNVTQMLYLLQSLM